MNLSAILADLYRKTNFPSSPAAATTTRLTAFVNETQADLMSEPGMEALLDDSVTFASVASTPEYSLPPVVSRIKAITEATNDIALQPMSAATYRLLYPDPTATTGVSTEWVDLGYSPVATQPSDASELFFKSDSASDNSSKSVTVEGYITGGYYRTATVAMNGTTAVSLGATITSWIRITKFEIVLAAGGTTTAAGNITLHEDSGSGTELARIHIGEAYRKYRRIALVVTPASAITYTVKFEREVTDMVNATDEPILPTRFHRMLVDGALMKEYEKTDNTRYEQARRRFEADLRLLKYWIAGQTSGRPNLRGPHTEPPSRYGGWFPSVH